jgi:protein-L-isoaspartate(D-aspartate) O-methyltransferase
MPKATHGFGPGDASGAAACPIPGARCVGRRTALAALAPLAAGRGAGAADLQAGRREVMVLTVEEHARRAEGALGRPSIDPRVLEAMRRVPRHAFVPPELAANAYEDRPLPIGHGQTISQPFIVALMTDMLRTAPGQAVLEVGTGSGYQAAVLSELAKEVFTIEIVEPLGKQARETLEGEGYRNVHVRIGDGYKGWPEQALFDAIIVTAAPPHVPEPLLRQVKIGGRIVLPVGEVLQDLQVLTRRRDGFDRQTVLPVRFVPMTGEAQREPR